MTARTRLQASSTRHASSFVLQQHIVFVDGGVGPPCKQFWIASVAMLTLLSTLTRQRISPSKAPGKVHGYPFNRDLCRGTISIYSPSCSTGGHSRSRLLRTRQHWVSLPCGQYVRRFFAPRPWRQKCSLSRFLLLTRSASMMGPCGTPRVPHLFRWDAQLPPFK